MKRNAITPHDDATARASICRVLYGACPYDMLFPAAKDKVDKLTAIITQVLAAQRERDAKAICPYCAKGTPDDPALPGRSHAIYHATGVAYAKCKAAAIRCQGVQR